MKKITLFSLLLLFLSALISSCAPKPDFSQNGIEIFAPSVRMVGPGAPSAIAYLQIKNASAQPDRLVSARADFGDASLHESVLNGDVMSMDEIPGIDFPAGALVELRSGSYHVMIINLRDGLAAGDTVHLTLEFEKAGPINFTAKVSLP